MKTRSNIIVLAVATALSMSVTSCQKADNSNAATNKTANTVAANTSPAANSATLAPVETSTSSAGTPSDAYKAAYAARKNKDVPGLKKLMSKDIIEFFTEISGLGEKKQTLDELLMELCEKPQAPTADVRNEKVNGNTATVEYLDEKGGWSTMDFVKEDGTWKLTIAKPEKGDVKVETDPKGKNNK